MIFDDVRELQWFALATQHVYISAFVPCHHKCGVLHVQHLVFHVFLIAAASIVAVAQFLGSSSNDRTPQIVAAAVIAVLPSLARPLIDRIFYHAEADLAEVTEMSSHGGAHEAEEPPFGEFYGDMEPPIEATPERPMGLIGGGRRKKQREQADLEWGDSLFEFLENGDLVVGIGGQPAAATAHDMFDLPTADVPLAVYGATSDSGWFENLPLEHVAAEPLQSQDSVAVRAFAEEQDDDAVRPPTAPQATRAAYTACSTTTNNSMLAQPPDSSSRPPSAPDGDARPTTAPAPQAQGQLPPSAATAPVGWWSTAFAAAAVPVGPPRRPSTAPKEEEWEEVRPATAASQPHKPGPSVEVPAQLVVDVVELRPPTAPQKHRLAAETVRRGSDTAKPIPSPVAADLQGSTRDWNLLFQPAAEEEENEPQQPLPTVTIDEPPADPIAPLDASHVAPTKNVERQLAALYAAQAPVRPASTRSQRIHILPAAEEDNESVTMVPVPFSSPAMWAVAEAIAAGSVAKKATKLRNNDATFINIGDVARAITYHRVGLLGFMAVNAALAPLLWYLASNADAAVTCIQFIPLACIAVLIDMVLVQSIVIGIRARSRVVEDEKHPWQCPLHPYDGQKKFFV